MNHQITNNKQINLKENNYGRENFEYPQKRYGGTAAHPVGLCGSDIAAAAGIDKEEASKVIKQLAKEGKIYSPKRCYYDIKK